MTDGEKLKLSKSLTPRTNKYIPIGWSNTRQMIFLLLNDVFEILYGGSAGGGKALSLDTPIPTPSGWTTMGDLREGDLVFSDTGEVTKVTTVFPIFLAPSYRITFDDNSTIDACKDHKWLTYSAKELNQLTRRTDEFRQRRRETRKKRGTGKRPDLAERNQQPRQVLPPPTGTVRSTEEIFKTVSSNGRKNHAIPIAGILDLPERDLPLDPYLFGLWLGDGSSSGDKISTADMEVVEAFKTRFVVKKYSGLYEYGINGLVTVLRSMGLIQGRVGKKVIPPEYLRSSPKQRLELLRGLMDSDGHACESGAVEFTTIIKELADQVLELILSLGHKATIREGRATLNGRYVGKKYRIKWTAPEIVFNLERKRKNQKLSTRRTTRFRYIKSVEEIPPTLMRCISVDSPSHLFLAGKQMVPTHNSEALLAAAAQFVDVPGYSALILRRSFRDLALPGALMDRSKKWWKQTDAHWDGTDYKWTFPSGATIQFGYMEHEGDELRYQSSEYQFIAFDELTQFPKEQYTYMFSRLRRLRGVNIPIRMRAATNPGGVGHCVPYGSVLTPNGWKQIQDFKVGDSVYAVDKTGTLVETSVEQVHTHMTDEIVNVDVRGLHMAVTPEHRVAKTKGTRLDPESIFSLIPFNELPGQATILRTVKWKGEPIGEVKALRPLDMRKGRHEQPESLTGVQYATLLGWLLTEGCLVDRDYAFSISQFKPDTREKLREFLEDDCGFVVSWSKKGATIYAPGWYQHFSELNFGKSRDKYVPSFVKKATQIELRAFFEAAMDGDGHRVTQTSGHLYTISKQLADDYAEIALKLGYVTKISHRERENRIGLSYEVSFKVMKSGGTELLTGNHRYDVTTATERKSNIKTERGEKPVFCIGLPEHHAFVIRQKGSVWVSGNSWVKERWGLGGNIDQPARTDSPDRVFIPAKLEDNPYLDADTYEKSFEELSDVTRAQLREGNWDIKSYGGRLDPNAFQVIRRNELPDRKYWTGRVRHWDFASQEVTADNPDPDWTVGCKLIRANKLPEFYHEKLIQSIRRNPEIQYPKPPYWFVLDVTRDRHSGAGVEELIRATAFRDGTDWPISMEQERGATGKLLIQTYQKNVLPEFNVYRFWAKGSKEDRAAIVSGRAGEGRYFVVEGHYVPAFLDELGLFGIKGVHDDQVDALSGAHLQIERLDLIGGTPRAEEH